MELYTTESDSNFLNGFAFTTERLFDVPTLMQPIVFAPASARILPGKRIDMSVFVGREDGTFPAEQVGVRWVVTGPTGVVHERVVTTTPAGISATSVGTSTPATNSLDQFRQTLVPGIYTVRAPCTEYPGIWSEATFEVVAR